MFLQSPPLRESIWPAGFPPDPVLLSGITLYDRRHRAATQQSRIPYGRHLDEAGGSERLLAIGFRSVVVLSQLPELAGCRTRPHPPTRYLLRGYPADRTHEGLSAVSS